MPISLPSDSSEPTPYLPMVNAIAPNAPIGASFMMMPTIANSTCDGLLDQIEHQRAAAAEAVQAEAEQHREQQHLQDLALGERVDHACSGMMFSRNSVVLCIWPGLV